MKTLWKIKYIDILKTINGLSAGLGSASISGIILSYLQNKPYLYPLFEAIGFLCLIIFSISSWLWRKVSNR